MFMILWFHCIISDLLNFHRDLFEKFYLLLRGIAVGSECFQQVLASARLLSICALIFGNSLLMISTSRICRRDLRESMPTKLGSMVSQGSVKKNVRFFWLRKSKRRPGLILDTVVDDAVAEHKLPLLAVDKINDFCSPPLPTVFGFVSLDNSISRAKVEPSSSTQTHIPSVLCPFGFASSAI